MAAESNPFYAGQDLDDINDIIGPQLQEGMHLKLFQIPLIIIETVTYYACSNTTHFALVFLYCLN